MSITFERQANGTYTRVIDPPKPADMVAVVRCRDCKNFASDELGDCCTLFDFEDARSMGDGFCAWGERRDA